MIIIEMSVDDNDREHDVLVTFDPNQGGHGHPIVTEVEFIDRVSVPTRFLNRVYAQILDELETICGRLAAGELA